MEGTINVRLQECFDQKGLLSKIQCGDRPERTNTNHLLFHEGTVRSAQARKNHAASVFFDMEQASDRTWRHGILKD